MLYAAPIWTIGLRKKYTGDMLTKARRFVALCIISGYRTVSTSAALVVASLPRIDLLVMERKELYASMAERTLIIARNEEIPTKSTLKKETRMRLFNKRQQRWKDEETGRWTHILIPDELQ